MYKRISLFLLIVLLVLCVFGGTITFCFNKMLNEEKLEDDSLYTNIIEGWNNTIGEKPVVLKENYYIEPIGTVMFATDANNNYIYAFEHGERFLDYKTNEFVKDKSGNYIYASSGDATYHEFFYATSCNAKYDYMFADLNDYKFGSQYFNFDAKNVNYDYLKNDKGQKLLTGKVQENIVSEVNFNKDAKIYYVIMLSAFGIGFIVLISLLVVFINGKLKERKALMVNL